MFQMDPSRSWQTLVLGLVIVGCLIWLVVVLEKRRAWRRQQEEETSASPSEAAVPARHLSLVPSLPQPAPQPIYDWQTQGI